MKHEFCKTGIALGIALFLGSGAAWGQIVDAAQVNDVTSTADGLNTGGSTATTVGNSGGVTTLNGDGITVNGDIDAGANEITTTGGISGGTVTATTGDIEATTGNIEATAGSVTAGTTVTAGTDITATTGDITATAGNIEATAGSVTAGTTVTAGTDITATTGNITATAGNIEATNGTVSGETVTAGVGGVSSDGDFTTTNGSFTTTNGNITASNGTITAQSLAVGSASIGSPVGTPNSGSMMVANTGQPGAQVDANGKITQGVVDQPTASLTVTNGQGNTHGFVVNERSATMSGGANSTSLTLNDGGARFSNASTGGPVRVTGIADGRHDYDAVNYRQLKSVKSGIAGIAAMTNIPLVEQNRKFALGVGVGHYDGATSMALGGSMRLSENAVIKASISNGIAGGTRKSTVYGIGAGFSW
jgi:hypothetical protein